MSKANHTAAGSLWDLLRNQTVAMEGETLLPLLRGVVVGMAFLHAHEPPVIHTDLKSSNILVSGWFQAKVLPTPARSSCANSFAHSFKNA